MADNGTRRQFSPRQGRALTALLTAGSVTGAAEASGISERQLSRYLSDPGFRAELRAAEGEAIGAAVRALAGLATDAVDVLGAILRDPTASAATRTRAADVVLGRLLELRQAWELEARVAALEGRIKHDRN